MPRRPTLCKTILLLAGLICLGVFLSQRGWCRAGTAAPARFAASGKAASHILPPSSQPAALEALSKSQSRGEAAFQKNLCQSPSFVWLSGGFLGNLLCHYVYGYPLTYVWQGGVWPPGLLDILAALTLGYLGYRLYRRLASQGRPFAGEAPPKFMRPVNDTPPPLTIREEAKPGLAAIRTFDQNFDPEAFAEDVRLLLLDLYAAWNREEVAGLNGRVKESLLEYLQMGLKIMSLREERSYLEDMVLESITVTDARVDDGKEFITVCFRGRLLDYVLDKGSGKLLMGSMAYPKTFQEYWDLERSRGQSTWVLQDIRDG